MGVHPRAMALVSVFLLLAFVTGGVVGVSLLRPAGGEIQPGWAGELTSVEGQVEMRSGDGSWQTAAAGDKFTLGDALRTAMGARVEVVLANGDLFRLSGISEISLDAYSCAEVRLRQVTGGSYHRSDLHTNYCVSAGGLEISAHATAFSVSEAPETGEVEVMCLYSDVQVASQQPAGTVTSSLAEGEKCRVTQSPGAGMQLQVDSMSSKDLEDEWLIWNRDRDLQRDLQLGVLVRLPLEIVPGSAGTPSSGAADRSREVPAVPGASQSVSFVGTGTDMGIKLSWQVEGYDDITGFQVFRSGDAAEDKATFTLKDASRVSYLDGSALPDREYQYQLAVCNGETVLAHSEIISVSGVQAAPVPQLSLDAWPRGAGVMLQGQLSGEASFTSFVLIRSTSRSSPSYPLEAGESAVQFISSDPQLLYWDGKVTPGQSYYYRLLLCQGDQVVLRSNTMSVYVPLSRQGI